MPYGAYWPESLDSEPTAPADNPELLHIDDVADLRRQVAWLWGELHRVKGQRRRLLITLDNLCAERTTFNAARQVVADVEAHLEPTTT